MMQMKNWIICVICMLVIAGSVLIPPRLSEIQDKNKLNKMRYSTMDALQLSAQKQLSAAEKIRLIASLGLQGKMVIMTEQQKAENTFLLEQDIQTVCIDEIKKLQDLKIFPSIDVGNTVKTLAYSVQTYVDYSEPSTYAIIWKVTLTYDGFTIDLSMDDETHTIYSFSILSKKTIKELNYDNYLKNWGSYLGITIDPANTLTTATSYAKRYDTQEANVNKEYTLGAITLDDDKIQYYYSFYTATNICAFSNAFYLK